MFHSTDILPSLLRWLNPSVETYVNAFDKNYSPVSSFGNFFVKKLCVDCEPLRNSDEYFIPRVDNESLRRFPFFDLPKWTV